MANSDNGHLLLRLYFDATGALEKMVEWLSAVLFFFILLVSLLQVFFRYVLNSPLTWSEETARYLCIFMVMLATSNALKRNAHIGIDVLTSKLPGPFQKPLKIFSCFVSMCVMGFLGFYAFRLTSRNFFTPTPAMRIPIGIPYLCMTFACFVSAFFGLFMTVGNILDIRQSELPAKEETQ